MTKLKLLSKRGQIAIWVIVALVIVGSIGILLLAGEKKKIDTFVQETYDVEPYIERCARQAVRETLTEMIPQGGFVTPNNYKQYLGTNVTYHCENIGNFETCINQHPALITEMRAELERVLSPRIDGCFLDLQDALEKRNSEAKFGPLHLAVVLGPGQVHLDIGRATTLENKGTTRHFERFDVTVMHPAYDLATVAIEISSQEAKYCYFEYVGYMALYPQFDIRKTTLSDSTKIYSIKDVKSEEVMRIAIRSCAIPPGI